MKADIRDRWIDALRSGRYAQGSHRLRAIVNGEKLYCCLGVLCEVSGYPERDWAGESTLPESIIGALGLHTFEQARLINLNDSEQRSFAHIADYIETNIEATPCL